MEREPLPYEHTRGPFDRGFPFACAHPEARDIAVFRKYDTCPGCRAFTAATIAQNPAHLGRSAGDGSVDRALDRFRRIVPDYDPIRVLLERHLASSED